MLELVGIGVLSACLSALLCIITEGTPFEVPKVISFKQGFLRPRIIRPKNWQGWKSGVKENARNQKNGTKKFPRNYKQHFRNSVQHFERYSQTIASKAVNNIKEYLKEDDKPAALLPAAKKDCEYEENTRKFEYQKSEKPKNDAKRIIIRKSVSRFKATFSRDKNDESAPESNGKERKIRTKKRRFILPKNLVVTKRFDNENQNLKTFDDDEAIQLNGRYCYLEALRIKANKATKNV